MRKPHCLTHTARFSRFSVNQTQAACSSFHQGEIRDTVKVTGSKLCSKQIDPYFRAKEKKNKPRDETQVHSGAVTVQKLTPSFSLRLPCWPNIVKMLDRQVLQVSTQNMQLAPCLHKKKEFSLGTETGLEDPLLPARLGRAHPALVPYQPSLVTHHPALVPNRQLSPITSSDLPYACSLGTVKNYAPAKS